LKREVNEVLKELGDILNKERELPSNIFLRQRESNASGSSTTACDLMT